ncbi:MAG TPA: SusC/RagA family TonB-linked outer membrane protein, partial [Lutibacter sp.]|nr:SusC/RagA family TonB-linked outer membrane protein [Lutibacter sp.]
AFAQKTISGTVSDETGPLPGVSVLIKGTTTGTETDFDGNYSIQAKKGQVLQYSFIGMETVFKTVRNSNKMNVLMSGGEVLEEVVITAMGIKREKKSLGYAVTTVKIEELQSKPEGDISRVLQGKVAGVNITPTGGMVGSGNNIIIRSKVSISGDNQPLYIVDGIPFNSSTDSSSGFTGFTGSSASSRSLDLDPNNIESISVLKGLSATVLYGNEGRNGVILITTKNGSTKELDSKFEVSISQTTSMNEISNLPDYQNKYGQGAGLNYNNNYIGNWGPEFDSNILVSHNYDKAWITDIFPEYKDLKIPYVAVPNNVKDFFRTGMGSSTSININKGGETASSNLSFSNTSESGYIPENSLSRITLGLGVNVKLTNKINAEGVFNYANTGFTSPPVSAGNGTNFSSSVFSRTLYIPRNFDLMNLPFESPVDGSNIYYRDDLDNPRWLLKNAGSIQEVNRFFGKFGVNFDLNEHFNFAYRVGIDQFTEEMNSHSNKGGNGGVLTQYGFLSLATGLNKTIDNSIILTGNGFNFSDNISLNVILGANAKKDFYNYVESFSTEQEIYGWLHSKNFRESQTFEYSSEKNVIGVYTQLELDFYKFFYLTLSARNDWSSTVEKEHQSIFYPSLSLAFLPTTAFKGIKGDFLNFLKIRGGYATSAGYPGVYRTRPRLGFNALTNGGVYGGISSQTVSNVLPNPNLTPELHKEIELGIEAKLFKNRIDIDLSLYSRDSKDQILPGAPLDPATGYTSTTYNLGNVHSEGIELGLGIKPIKTDNFLWNINTNFTTIKTIVTDLGNDLDKIVTAGFTNLGNFAVEGEPLNVIIGDYALLDENGNYMIDYTDGTVINNYDLGDEYPQKIIGDPNPDWQATLINSISFKGFRISGQLEYTHGGDVYSLTASRLWRRGVTTANILDREGAVVLPGTLADPATGEPVTPNGETLADGEATYANTIPITVNSLYFINTIDNDAANIYDGSLIRLREVSISYEISKDLLKRTPFGSMSISVTGNNLWFDAINFPDAFNFDPEVISTGTGNGDGLEFMTAPSAKKYGFSIKVTF